jgi:molybdopterin-binding protein
MPSATEKTGLQPDLAVLTARLASVRLEDLDVTRRWDAPAPVRSLQRSGRPARRVLGTREEMALSARNQLPGKIKDIQIGDIMAHVVVKVGKNLIESVITRNSALELGLKKGDSVKVVVKSTEVMIQKD